jgi:3-hydroxyacyl-[acyl-carrier-protein] dehydratase
MPPKTLIDFSKFDFNKPMFNLQEIRKVNPQRDHMEQLSAVVHVNPETHSLVGYKDVTHDEFWCTGHMPGFPLMPGVILCECAAQLAGFYARKYNLLGGEFLGFGGMNDVRFRSPVFPGNRLIILVQLLEVRQKIRATFAFQGFVEDRMVFNGEMIGVPINRSTQVKGDPNVKPAT